MGKRCFLVSGGDFSPVPRPLPDDFVIACDKGYTYCEKLGRSPDLLISDFDSYRGPVNTAVPLAEYPSEKDRLDHLYANLQSLVFARRHGLAASLRSADTEVYALQKESMAFPRREGWSLSVFAADGPCRGVSITGAKYPLACAEVPSSLPLGVSNKWASDAAEISVEEGVLLVILSRFSPEEDAAETA